MSRLPNHVRCLLMIVTALCLSWGSTKAFAQAPDLTGCFLNSSKGSSVHLPAPIMKTDWGNVGDAQLSAIVSGISAAFHTTTFFSLYDDAQSPNAFATSAKLDGRALDGTVMVGRTLLNGELRRTLGNRETYTVAAIVAHEYTHILQAKRGSDLTVMQRELQADFMSGWWLGRTRMQYPNVVLEDGMRTFFKFGDYDFNNPDHHGTPEQLLAAFTAGTEVADSTLNVAFRKSREFVTGD